MSGPRYRRRVDVLWRLADDRVVARRISGDGLDLVGAAAMVWVALDQGRVAGDVLFELQTSDPSASTQHVDQALAQLMDAGLVEVVQ